MPTLAESLLGRDGALAAREPVMVGDLREGLTIALPFRESLLLWRVIAAPVPCSSRSALVLLQRVDVGRGAGVPVALGFLRTAVVDQVLLDRSASAAGEGLGECGRNGEVAGGVIADRGAGAALAGVSA